MIKIWKRKLVLAYFRRQQQLTKIRQLKRPSFVSQSAVFTFHARISIGQYCRIGTSCHLDGEGGIEIGDGTILAPSVTILSSSHNYQQSNHLPYDETDKKLPVKIGAGVWIGYGAFILPGVAIGNGAVVGAGSVVVKDVGAGEIVGGNPAKNIGNRTISENELEEMVRERKFYLRAVLDGGASRLGRETNNLEVLR